MWFYFLYVLSHFNEPIFPFNEPIFPLLIRYFLWLRAGVAKLRPADHMQPSKDFLLPLAPVPDFGCTTSLFMPAIQYHNEIWPISKKSGLPWFIEWNSSKSCLFRHSVPSPIHFSLSFGWTYLQWITRTAIVIQEQSIVFYSIGSWF